MNTIHVMEMCLLNFKRRKQFIIRLIILMSHVIVTVHDDGNPIKGTSGCRLCCHRCSIQRDIKRAYLCNSLSFGVWFEL